MTTYYELLEDGTIGSSTTDEKIANALGLTRVTDREIVYGYDGKRYFKGEEPPRPPVVSEYDAVLEKHLLAERVARGYTTREPSAYFNSANPRWAQDAADWISHVDAVMDYALAIENRVAAGEPVPSVAEFEAGLPRIVWTYGAGVMEAEV